MSLERGLFVVLEGADGCGKSTQAARLAASLGSTFDQPVHHVRDPGTTPVAEGIRGLLLDPQYRVDPRTELFLYLAARAQLVAETVRPALERSEIVVCERWSLSTEVYQGVAGELGLEAVRAVAPQAEVGATPDLVIVLDVAEGEGLDRVGPERDRMEAKGDAFHAAVVRAYRALATDRERHVVVPPGPLDAVTAAIDALVRPLLSEVSGGV